GIDPHELGGSPWVAAVSSFVPFVVGAIVPVIPFVFLDGTAAVVTSLVASGVALFGIGAAITLLTGRSVLFSGARQVAFGLAAAGVTYGIGAAIGVSVSG
ncbi:MAG TPA: VIT1/CCC1 transporter family protein, partial [Gaiella sp.]|nr:VIT1/CCC1 transporter family protein [Gaiella sp.]